MKLLVLFEGRRFVGRADGEPRRFGFYANRRVAAASIEAFDQTATCESLVEELRQLGVETIPGTVVRAVRASEFDETLHTGPFDGFSFFPDETRFARWIRKWMDRWNTNLSY